MSTVTGGQSRQEPRVGAVLVVLLGINLDKADRNAAMTNALCYHALSTDTDHHALQCNSSTFGLSLYCNTVARM